MVTYNLETICEDFGKVMGGYGCAVSEMMKKVAIEMLVSLPDNRGRDFAISNLLYSAEFVKASILEEQRKQCPKK